MYARIPDSLVSSLGSRRGLAEKPERPAMGGPCRTLGVHTPKGPGARHARSAKSRPVESIPLSVHMPGIVFLPLRARETLSSSHQPNVSHATNKFPETQDIPRCSRRVISQACAMSGRASPSTGQMVVFRPGSWNHSSGRVCFAGRHWGMR